MKRRLGLFFVVAGVFAWACGLSSCKKGTAAESSGGMNLTVTPVLAETTEDRVFDPGNFFTPDYTPYEPEPESVAGKLRLSATKGAAGKVAAIVPGLRKLSDYLTKYSTRRTEFKRPEIKASDEAAGGMHAKKTGRADEPFTVADWGPKDAIPSEVRYPSFYVLFSEPVVALSALGEQSDRSEYVSIEPPVKGVFRWNGTSLLSFDCTETVNPLQAYRIVVSDKAKSLGGKTISGKTSFETKAASLAVIWSAPGYSKSKWVDRNEVPPEYAHEFRVQFNYPVRAEDLKSLSSILFSGSENAVGGEKIPFDVRQELADTVTYTWKTEPPFNSYVILNVTQESGDERLVATSKFHTLSPFAYQYDSEGWTSGKYTNPWRIEFSHPVSELSALSAVSAKTADGKALPITKDNLEARGDTLIVYGLPVAFHSTYTIAVSKNLKDIYGRELTLDGNAPLLITVKVPGPESAARFIDSGVKMLESQFPHRLVFEHQNIDEGAYVVDRTAVPYATEDWGTATEQLVFRDSPESLRHVLPTAPRDERLFEVVDFDHLLTDGLGWIDFKAAVKLPKKPTKWSPETYYWQTNKMSVQVTNLGVTVRYGMNKVVALVTRLSDGTPVEGASVYASKDRKSDYAVIKKNAPCARTDKQGMAVINLRGDDAEKVLSDEYWNVPAVFVEKDGDKVLFRPEDHSPWRSGIYSYGSVPNKIKAEPRIFMFSDRGLYKPGETVSFRGIDRDQILGSFIPYKGDYTVTLQEDGWRNAKEFAVASGTVSESGGFYGSLAVPEDIEPGMYLLRYQRADGKKRDVYINVAFFERLTFQTALTMPQTPVLAGEKVQANLSASYLAGGSLSNASYEINWFREPWYFTSSDAAFSQYVFGPVNTTENRSHISDAAGSLDANGETTLSCETTGNSIKGAPYRYRLSAEVTDVSNKLVASSGATIVHPASYYIGLSKPETTGAFARKGEKLTFAYKLASPDGTPVSGDKALAVLAGKSRKIKVTLTREEWNLVQQQGISDIYSRYEKNDVVESERTVSLSADGKITVSPQEPGYHRIQLASVDRAGRDVITEYEFFVTGSGHFTWSHDDASSLRLTPDKNQYNPGETAHILLESALPEGNYLITVEREGIFTEEVRHLDGSIHVLDIPVARNYVPVFYVSVSSYSTRHAPPSHTYGEVDLDKPKGYYGATTVFVNPRVKSFTVKMESEKPSYRPGEEAEVTLLATKGGKPLANAELTLMAVDRGVLDLVDYHVPDPISFFYDVGNFPLRVRGGDSREYLMDPVTYEVKNLKGGDSGEDEKMNERKDFNPTAVFEPMLKTDETGRVKVRFKLPDTLTTYRLTAFGVHGELLSLQEDEIAVQNPITVQQVLPRALRERDTAELGVLLTNLDGNAHDVTVSLSIPEDEASLSEDESGITPEKGNAAVDGAHTHTVSVPSGASTTVYFDVAAEKAGMVQVSFTVTSDVLNERLIVPLSIERPYLFESVTTTGQIASDETAAAERIAIPSWAESMNGEVSVTLDTTRLGILGGAVQYLFEYPYGCLEQQSSKVLPLVVFGDYISTFGLHSDVTNVHSCVVSFFKEWKKCQHTDGSFGYWPTSARGDWYVSAKIAHLYALALHHGYSKRELAIDIDKLLSYLEKEILREEEHSAFLLSARDENIVKTLSESLFQSDYARAYMYYVQALHARSVSDSHLAELIDREHTDIAVLALSGLAALETKKTALSDRAASKIRTYMRPTARGVDITNPHAPHEVFAYYGDAAENLALSLQLFTMIDKDDEMNSRLLYSLMQNQRAGYWKNTATTARVLDAIATVIRENNLAKTNVDAKATLSGTEIAKGAFKGAAAKPVTVTMPFGGDLLKSFPKDTEIPLSFSKKGKGALYYTATMRYALPQELQGARDEGLGLVMRLYDNATGEEIKCTGDSDVVPLVELESGKTYKVTLTLSSAYDRDFVALRAPVPSGAEILDATFVTSPDMAEDTESGRDGDEDDGEWASDGSVRYESSHCMSNQAVYDNEVRFFWDSFGKGKTTAEFKFRAVRRGVFPTPPANGECMYAPEVFGRTDGILYTIR